MCAEISKLPEVMLIFAVINWTSPAKDPGLLKKAFDAGVSLVAGN
jgi:hypothetical protein